MSTCSLNIHAIQFLQYQQLFLYKGIKLIFFVCLYFNRGNVQYAMLA